MSENTKAASFPPTNPTLESDDYIVFHGNDSLVIMSAREDGVVLTRDLACTEGTLLIYAETVILASDQIQVPGLHLGIFCNRLILSPSNVVLDVSGTRGENGNDKRPGGGNGGKGGSIWLYVEDPAADLPQRLILRAYGGDGGSGHSQTVDQGQNGGDGGQGGVSGTIRCYIGCGALFCLRRLHEKTMSSNWSRWVKEISGLMDNDVQTMLSYGIDKDVANEWSAVVQQGVLLGAAAEKLRVSLTTLTEASPLGPDYAHLSEETSAEAATLLKTLVYLLKDARVPLSPHGDEIESLAELANLCDSFTGKVQEDMHLRRIISHGVELVKNLIPQENETASSLLDSTLKKVLVELRAASNRFRADLAQNVCELGGGKGGSGGTGATLEIAAGKRGNDMPDAPARVKILSLDGIEDDSDIEQACAIPEQCQMVLDQADAIYFTNKVNEFPKAMLLYDRLARRLAFVDGLASRQAKPAEPDPLTREYWSLEKIYGLTFEALQQLSRIHTTARLRLNKIVLGQDMFCHSDTWVPRLSLTYYEQRVKDMLGYLASIEDAYKVYSKAEQKGQVLKDQIGRAITLNRETSSAMKNQIELITKPGGELEAAGTTIAQLSPKLTSERAKLAAGLEGLKKSIQSHFQISLESLLDSFTMLASAPHISVGLAQVASVEYKAWTKVENLEGTAVNKDYIIDQLATCEGNITSLTESYEHLKNGELSVQDPGYGKILATTQTVQKLLDDFKKAIPSEQHQTVQAQLKGFIDLVTKRNNAVVQYNAQLQYLLELENMLRASSEESSRLGDAALSLNPSLPAIYFWLKQVKSNMQIDIMQRLNYEARALAFWGPMDFGTFEFTGSSALRGSLALQGYQQDLGRVFEQCYGAFKLGAWSYWPSSQDLRGAGIRVDVTESVFQTIKKVYGTKEDAFHEATFRITPKSHHEFADMANVRLTQARVWLLGATVSATDDHYPLKIEIQHAGSEKIWATDGRRYCYDHDPLHLQMKYETSIFNRQGTCSGDPELVYGRQAIENDYSSGNKPKVNDRPPIGPFTDWTIRIRHDVNPGIDLTGLTKVWIEFCGRNLPALQRLSEAD